MNTDEQNKSVNHDVFYALAQNTIDVWLPSVEMSLKCRRAPFKTVTTIITRFVEDVQAEFATRSDNFLEEMINAFNDVADEGKKEQPDVGVLTKLVPVFNAVIVSSTPLLNSFLKDVIVDADDDLVDTIPAEDGVAIVNAVLRTMDMGALARNVQEIFLSVTAAATATKTLQESEGNPNT